MIQTWKWVVVEVSWLGCPWFQWSPSWTRRFTTFLLSLRTDRGCSMKNGRSVGIVAGERGFVQNAGHRQKLLPVVEQPDPEQITDRSEDKGTTQTKSEIVAVRSRSAHFNSKVRVFRTVLAHRLQNADRTLGGLCQELGWQLG